MFYFLNNACKFLDRIFQNIFLKEPGKPWFSMGENINHIRQPAI